MILKTGKDIRRLRLRLRLSQTHFADRIGYRLNRISVVERTDAPIHFNLQNAIRKTFGKELMNLLLK